jgi:polysaccharide biosynthesis protein PslJ
MATDIGSWAAPLPPGNAPSGELLRTGRDDRPSVARHPWAWCCGLGAVGIAAAIGAPVLVVACLLGVFLAAVFYLSPGDATTVLSLALGALFVIHQRFVFEPLGAAGTPAVMLGLAAFVWWVVTRVNGSSLGVGYNPVRIGVFILITAMLVAYAAGFARAILPVETRGADRAMLTLLGYSGFLLLCADGVTNRNRLDVLLRRLVWGGAYMSFVAILQFFLNLDLAELLKPPGLAGMDSAFLDKNLLERGTFTRVTGTALHPIEFSVVVAALLPIGLHFAFTDRHRGVLARWVPVVLMGFGMPLAISRSGFLGLALALLCFLPAVPTARRFQMVVIGMAAAGVMTVAVPGLLATAKGFFYAVDTDTSVSARTDDYLYLNTYFTERPIAGRGFGTFIPELYDVFDNQYLLTAIEAGTLGVAALLLFLFSGLATARVVRKRSTDPATRSLAQALFAGVMAHVITFATYDALVFPTAGMSLFLLIGAIGALWRLSRQEEWRRRLAPPPGAVLVPPPLPSR